MKRHVALVGFMASGKSTIGRKLARKLGWSFVDTDAIVARAHGPIVTIFGSEGEAEFRRYEADAVRLALDRTERSVVALGGGSLTIDENRALLEQRAFRVFIKVPPEQILARVRRSREARPLLGAAPTLARIKALYSRRLAHYAAADLVVDAAHRSDAKVVEEIVVWLQGQLSPDARAAS